MRANVSVIVFIIVIGMPYTLSQYCDECPSTCKDENLLRNLIYVFVFLMLFMLAVICGLVVLLFKAKRQGKTTFVPTSPQTAIISTRSLMTQKSQENMTILEIKQCDEMQNSFQDDDYISLDNTKLVGKKDNSKGKIRDSLYLSSTEDFKAQNLIKKHLNENLILKEQMKKICEAALAKSKSSGVTVSLKDLNDLLQQEGTELPEAFYGTAKSMLGSQDLEMYDDNPSNVPIEDDIYANVAALSDSHSDITLTQEPAYINARYIHSRRPQTDL